MPVPVVSSPPEPADLPLSAGLPYSSAGTTDVGGESLGKLGVLRTQPFSKWNATEVGGDILGSEWSISYCMKRQTGGATSVKCSPSEKKAWYGGLMTCGSVWLCPICSLKIAARRAEEIRRALANNPNLVPVLVTLTLQHKWGDKLRDLMNDLKAAWRYTFSGTKRKRFNERFGVKGYINSTEVRVSLSTGWHPHMHVLFLLEKGEKPNLQDMEACLLAGYGKHLVDKGYLVNGYTIDVRMSETTDGLVEEYLTKSAIQLSVSAEVSGGQLKESSTSLSPFQLLYMYRLTGDEVYAQLYREYAVATKGRKQLAWSRNLKKELLPDVEEKSDEELVAEEEVVEDEQVLEVLDREEWQKVCEENLRGELLQVACHGNRAWLQAWLIGQGIIRPPDQGNLRTMRLVDLFAY